MDIGDTVAPTSDQLDAVDLLAGPRTFTVERVVITSAEQPVNIYLKEFDRPWRPGKSMRRVLLSVWGNSSAAYAGRRLTLWCDPEVRFGGAAVGGVRITHMSHIDKRKSVPLIVTRGKSAGYPVQPLVETAPATHEVSLALRGDQAVSAFGRGGVTLDQLEKRIGRVRDEWTAQDVDDLEALFGSLSRREISKDEAFPPAEPDPTDNGEMPNGGVR